MEECLDAAGSATQCIEGSRARSLLGDFTSEEARTYARTIGACLLPSSALCPVNGLGLLFPCDRTWQMYSDEVTKQGFNAEWNDDEKARDSAQFFDALSELGLYGVDVCVCVFRDW